MSIIIIIMTILSTTWMKIQLNIMKNADVVRIWRKNEQTFEQSPTTYLPAEGTPVTSVLRNTQILSRTHASTRVSDVYTRSMCTLATGFGLW